ncbi:nuclease PIN [Escherichia coli]|uniref:nuclease PIN n=1 Tax=Escherichia coli TaxID=562 RepID=UPI0015926339|nr:nuclease PIN [Escherichia coli]
MRFCIILTLIFCNSAFADYCSLLWLNRVPPKLSLDIEPDDLNKGIKLFPLDLIAGGDSIAIDSRSEGMTDIIDIDGQVRYWIQYKEGWQTIGSSGLRYRIVDKLELVPHGTLNAKTVLTPIQPVSWKQAYGCATKGSTYNFMTQHIQGLYLELDTQNADPRSNMISLPIKLAYEENKGFSNMAWPSYPFVMDNSVPVTPSILYFRIKPQCRIVQPSLTIDLGSDITPGKARAGVHKKTDFWVACNGDAIIHMRVQGSNPVSGIPNTTQCGHGICTLKFDNGSDYTYISAIKGQVMSSINVIFTDNMPQPGPFKGSAILSIEVL